MPAASALHPAQSTEIGSCARSWRAFVRTSGACAALLALVLLGCRSAAKSDGPAPKPLVASAPAAPKPSCREGSGAAVVVLGSGEVPKELAQDDEQAEEFPFSVELGAARSGAGRFAVAGLENRRGATFAFAAFVAADGSGQSVELLRVFGDAEPPALTASEEGFLIAAASSDAAGPTLRLLRVDPPFSARDVRRGEEVTGVRRDASGFSLASAEQRALIAFGKLEKGAGRVAVAAIDAERLALLGAPRLIELADGLEAESPQLAVRQGGFYLAFIGRAKPGARPLSGPSSPTDSEDEVPVVEAGPSGLFLLPLDEAGSPLGSARELSPPGAHVSTFEMARWGDAQVLLVYREDPHGPGLERSSVEAVLAAPDGSITRRTWELGETTGLPTVLIDAAPPKAAPPGWVVVHGESDVRIGALGADPLALPAFVSELSLRGSEPAWLLGGQMLRARSRGVKIELDLVSCQ
jgi:hypothetical protein